MSIEKEAWVRALSSRTIQGGFGQSVFFDNKERDGTGAHYYLLGSNQDRKRWLDYNIRWTSSKDTAEKLTEWYRQVPTGKMMVDVSIATNPEDPPARVLKQIRWLMAEVRKVSPVAVHAVANPDDLREGFISLEKLIEVYQRLGLEPLGRDGDTMVMGTIF